MKQEENAAGLYSGRPERWELLIRRHAEIFGHRPLRLFSAPGRTELSGNHTDHNHGQVLAAAIDLDTIAAVSASQLPKASLYSDGYDGRIEVDLDELEPRTDEPGSTAALVRGVAAGLAERGCRPGGFDAVVSSTVARGSGLSSSAAFEVLIGTIFNHLSCGGRFSPLDIARIGQSAENRFFGKPCGLMDQTASAVGGIVAIDFQDPAAPVLRRLSFDFSSAGYVLVVVDTGGSHADLTHEYAAIPAEMKAVAACFGRPVLRGITREELLGRLGEIRRLAGDRAVLRSFHFIGENQRVEAQAAALEAGDMPGYLELVRASGQSSWKLLQNCTPAAAQREQNVSLALALSEAFLAGRGACRVHGGGFAGTIQAYVPADRFEDYRRHMQGFFGPACVQKLRIRALGAVEVPLLP